MLRTLIWFIYFGLSLAATLPELILTKRAAARGDTVLAKAKAVRKARSWARQLIWIAGGKITVEGAEAIPRDEAFLVVSNHQSNFDIPIMLGYFPVPLGFVAKIEMLKMWIVRDWMTYLMCLFMDRGDFRQSVQVINQGAQQLRDGHSVIIFPEGTRSPDGHLGDFKPGSIKMAMKAGVRILPVTIDGSIALMRKGEKIIRPAAVRVIVHEPVASDGDSVALMATVKGIISSALSEAASAQAPQNEKS